jgi:hypothetical protein
MSNGDYVQITAQAIKCPTCGCTDRGPWHNRVTRDICGRTFDGFEFTSVVWIRTECLAKGCGQKYRVKFYMRPAKSEVRTD